jgi:hypothetical protein
MTISEQVDALQAKVAELKSSLDASRHETNEQIKARVATARAKAEAAQHTVHGEADQAADHAHTQWQSFKADTSAKMAELRGRIERKRDERDVKAAERRRGGGGRRGRRAGLRGLGHRPGRGGGARCRRCPRLGRRASGSLAAQLSTPGGLAPRHRGNPAGAVVSAARVHHLGKWTEYRNPTT